MDLFYVYILFSASADKFYVGQTDNLDLRLKFHNNLSENSFTAKYRPWILKRAIPVQSRSQAVRLEKYIKRRKSKRFIINLIHDQMAVERLLHKLGLSSSVG